MSSGIRSRILNSPYSTLIFKIFLPYFASRLLTFFESFVGNDANSNIKIKKNRHHATIICFNTPSGSPSHVCSWKYSPRFLWNTRLEWNTTVLQSVTRPHILWNHPHTLTQRQLQQHNLELGTLHISCLPKHKDAQSPAKAYIVISFVNL